jgi:nitroreductase/NAD-dependent dihydropyrimidine dehydrogenase PreA subunit
MEKRFFEQPLLSINKETCSQCGLCSKICPVRIYGLSEEGTFVTMNRLEECCLCGQCISGCTTCSIIHSGFVPTNFKQILKKKPVSPELAFEFLSQRRSVRNYKKEIPSKELLDKIVQIAGYAPGSPHHRIGWVRNITIVYGEDNMKTVLDLTADYIQKMLKLLHSVFFTVIAKFSDSAKAGLGVIPDLEMRLNEYKNGRDSITYNAPVAMFFHAPTDSSLPQSDCDAAQLLVQLYAEANGLGTCWNGLIQGAAAGDHLQGFKKLSEFLRIPKGHKCYAAMTVGYPSIKLHSIPERKVDVSWVNGNN